jgi:hypothetical protein
MLQADQVCELQPGNIGILDGTQCAAAVQELRAELIPDPVIRPLLPGSRRVRPQASMSRLCLDFSRRTLGMMQIVAL